MCFCASVANEIENRESFKYIIMATSYYENFVKKLEELFSMDHAELDFGIYRIMNQKREEIRLFLNNDLLPQVKKILAENASDANESDKTRIAELQQQLGENIDNLPDTIPMVREYKQLRAKLEQGADLSSLEDEVYSHLTTFFGRYYDEGDFVSKRRYKDNTYAIPYQGEEVKLHWANSDQYYIKTSEYFQNYTFKTTDQKTVHFVLKDASTELNNNKSQKEMERRFALYDSENEPTVEVIQGDLYVYFTYELMPKATKQKDLCAQALDALRIKIPSGWESLMVAVSSSDARSLLEKHLVDYTSKNSFDYFIHKDLRAFLSRELDFYIKNEVLHIDDLDANLINAQLAKVKAIKGVGDKIIRFLASLEDFQRKLWLKKKFVVQSDYCITLDRIPESLYKDICLNEEQRKEWVRLFSIDEIKGDGLFNTGYSVPLSLDFLKKNQYLVLDTAFFSRDFKHKLLASIDNLDEQINGLLINSENFQALQLLQQKYSRGIKCIYIDPPYNAPASEVLYKNSYKHSSWISLMDGRLNLSKKLATIDGSHCIAIDKYEHNNLFDLCKTHFGDMDVVSVAIEHNKKGTMGDHFSFSNEYAIFAVPYQLKHLNEKVREEKNWEYSNLRNWGGESERGDAANCFFPIYVRKGHIIGYGDVLDDSLHPKQANENLYGDVKMHTPGGDVTVTSNGDIIQVWPIDAEGVERKWRYAFQSILEIYDKLIIETGRDRSIQIKMPKYSDQFKTLWAESIYNAGDNGTKVLTALGFTPKDFAYPKSIYTVKDCVFAISDNKSIVLDYFAGSGTTAQSVMMLNKEDQGSRRYILCEMGGYFSSVTKPRVEKVIYSPNWRDGKPVSREGVSHCFKYIRLEQYEDTLNNLVLNRPKDIFSESKDNQFKESYMLGYMMDIETKGSLFNLDWFLNPFAIKLKTTKDNELVDTQVDMVETFNFLIGLNVDTMHWHQDDSICVVEGTTHQEGEKALIIWRDCTKIDNEKLNRFFEKMDYSTLAHDFDVIYVNGDNTLPNLRLDDDRWKVVLIEEEFQKRMFEEE